MENNSQHSNGSYGELIAAADLTRMGYEVFIPLNRHSSCDLIALDVKKGKTYRVEVKKGSGSPSFNQVKNDLYDILVNVKETEVLYRGKWPFVADYGRVVNLEKRSIKDKVFE